MVRPNGNDVKASVVERCPPVSALTHLPSAVSEYAGGLYWLDQDRSPSEALRAPVTAPDSADTGH